MSWADIAAKNVPESHMAHPDPGLADGHFIGEHEAHNDADHKINILPAGSDPTHPDVHPHGHIEPPTPVHLNPTPAPEPHVSESAPKPTPAPHKHDIHIPESGAKYTEEHKKAEADKRAKEAEKKVKETEKKAKETAEDAKKKTKEVADEAGKKAEDVAIKAVEVKDEVVDKAEEAAQKGKKVAGDVAEKSKQVAGDVAEKSKQVAADVEKKSKELARDVEKKSKEVADKAKVELNEAKNQLGPYWEKTKDVVLRPGTLGGLMGVVNVGLLSTLGYYAYTRRDQPWDRRIVGSAIAGTLALFGAEGLVADSYLNTPEGKQEAERAKREGSKFYGQTKEVILRPGVFGGLAGTLNLAVLGTVGYFSYINWNRPWDRQTVSAVTIGLVALSGIEGWAGKKYKDEELPKRR